MAEQIVGRRRDLVALGEFLDVSYLGSLYVPSDESCFCRFTAPDADSVARVNELAGVTFARVVAAVDLSNRKGESPCASSH